MLAYLRHLLTRFDAVNFVFWVDILFVTLLLKLFYSLIKKPDNICVHAVHLTLNCLILITLTWCSYEKRYTEEAKLNPSEKTEENVAREISSAGTDKEGTTDKSKNSTSSISEQDLDVFLLGDTGDSDEGPGTWLPLTNPWNNWLNVASVLHACFNVEDYLIIHFLLKSYY